MAHVAPAPCGRAEGGLAVTRHLLRLIWNRKRMNLLVMVEIFIAFLVLALVVTFGAFAVSTYVRPLGFDYEDVWAISVAVNTGRPGVIEPAGEATAATMQEVWRAVEGFPEVSRLAGAHMTPWDNSSWNSDLEFEGRLIEYGVNAATDDFAAVMGVGLTSGRWFDRSDDASTQMPAVITERMAIEMFGTVEAAGRTFRRDRAGEGAAADQYRVVGVIAAFRQHGEFTGPEIARTDNYLFERLRIDDARQPPPRSLVVKVNPGTTAELEPRILRQLQRVAPGWSFEITPLVQKRETFKRFAMVFYIVSALIAGSLTLMVAMGLTGVVWQTITQRIREMGLRRANGASARRIRRQILGELGLMTTISVAAGLLLLVQPPVLGVAALIGPGVFAAGLAVSVVAIYVVTVLCGVYPSLLATEVPPADALRYE